jgi:hypothetical protein
MEIRPEHHSDGSWRFTDTSGTRWRVRRLPVRSRGWHAEQAAGQSWLSTRYAGRSLRAVLRQMAGDGKRPE